ncbi:MAG TPA: alkaline phosphatase PhoX, partial [Roseomonas sp.]
MSARDRDAAELTQQALEDIGSNPAPFDPIGAIAGRRMARRAALRGLFGAAAAGALPGIVPGPVRAQASPSTLGFRGLPQANGPAEAVADGYEIQILIRWGDPVLPGAPAFDPAGLTAEAQALQFGYNNDYLDFFPLPRGAGGEHGLLVVNHEYTNAELMFPGLGIARQARPRISAAQMRAEMMAHGASVVEIRRQDGRWAPVPGGT